MEKGTKDEQSRQFRQFLIGLGFRSMTVWQDNGFHFELFSYRNAAVLFETYPEGHGFEVWRPLTTSAKITDTEAAVKAYAETGL